MSTIKDEAAWEAEGLGIAGRQLVEGKTSIKGDLLVSPDGHRFIEEDTYEWYGNYRIYRKIPVCKAGDLDNPPPKAANAPLSPIDAKLPTDAKARKNLPIARGCLDYFPDALLAIANVSRVGNEQHNPGKPMFWDRTKSTDEADAAIRHFLQRGKMDTDGLSHSAKFAWRALALLQKEIEDARKGE